MANNPTLEQEKVLKSDSKNLIVSASAGSGKTYVLINYITNLICRKENPVPVKRLLVLTFTKAAAGEMRERLNKSILAQKQTPFLLEQIDDLSISDISTIDAFCEKVIKRNLEKTELDENFIILDNELALSLQKKAFDCCIEKIGEESFYQEVYFSFRKNKQMLFEGLCFLYDFFSSQKDESLIEKIENTQDEIFVEAVEVLSQHFDENLDFLRLSLQDAMAKTEGKYQEFVSEFIKSIEFEKSYDFFEKTKSFANISFPSLPRLAGENKDENQAFMLKKIKDKATKLKEFAAKFEVYDEVLLKKSQRGDMAIALIKVYKEFFKHYQNFKSELAGLDFADIEKTTFKLLKNKDVLSSLQEKYDYIFVDEYQDTNSLQEAIVKPIAQSGKFFAVGDLKQGIYGFRNASMEIMQKDIKDFSESDDGDALYLKGNFRSERGILAFVNKVFGKVMTKESVGIDYNSTSQFEGMSEYDKQAFPSVTVDIIQNQETELTKKPPVYSVKNDSIFISEKNALEIDTIIARIDKLLTQKLYDIKAKNYRAVQPGDITILFRGRTQLMTDLSLQLQKKGFPVTTEGKFNIMEEPEIVMLSSLISLSVNFENDIALASVMASFLGGFSLEELAEISSLNDGKLHEFVLNSNDEKMLNFKYMLSSFTKNCQIFGVAKALEKLFAQKGYFAYLAFQEDGDERTLKVTSFISDILASGYDFDRASLLNYLESINSKSHAGQGGQSNSITLTTIHASKGLEYPIVILAGCGENLSKPNRKSFAINSKLGLGTFAFNHEKNLKCTTPVFEAVKLQNKRREFIDEIMIFYVALTRAKNHLYIVGKESHNDCDFFDQNNYLDLIFYSFGQQFFEKVLSEESVETENWQFNYVTSIGKIEVTRDTSLLYKADEKVKTELENYFSFIYPYQNVCTLPVKNSVTSILNLEEIEIEKTGVSQSREQAIEEGNLHHEALRKIDFEKVADFESFEKELQNCNFSQESIEKIDKNILFKNIITLKKIISGIVFKEKEFIMKVKLSEISQIKSDDEVLVQGAIDLFCIGENNVLIDYKFTNQKNAEKIKEKYKKQIELYSIAIEKAYNLKLNKKYILSLKNNELIEIN